MEAQRALANGAGAGAHSAAAAPPNGVAPGSAPGSAAPSTPAATSAPPPPPPPPPPPAPAPVSANMSPAQLAQLRTQVAAYKQLARNQPVPPHVQAAALGAAPPSGAPASVEGALVERVVEGLQADEARVGASAGAADKAGPGPELYAMEFDTASPIYPYNAYTAPSTYLRPNGDIPHFASKMQRTLIPSLMPRGLDPHLLKEERDRHVDARVQWRIAELENLFANGADTMGAQPVPGITHTHFTFNGRPIAYEGRPVSSGQVRALNELRMLRLRDKQKALREDMVREMNAQTLLPTERTEFRRFRNFSLRDARSTEDAERKQRNERERASKDKHLQYVRGICDHGRELVRANRNAEERQRRMGNMIAKMHRDIEREEQKRIERLSKERLKALKNDDEDGYRALIDQAKDHRIAHLLARTDAYLDSLADQIQVQKKDIEEGGLPRSMQRQPSAVIENADQPDPEAKLDYNGATHQIKEKVVEQAKMLSGGTLKSYQVAGLEWMVSLHNNKLNGILADEMVRARVKSGWLSRTLLTERSTLQGLGKTIQTLALITYLIEKKGINGPFLVIVPLSTITNWQSEFNRWAPTVRTIVLKGAPATRKVLLEHVKRVTDWDVVLTTYEYITRQAEALVMSRIKWHHVIIDEGHRLKNAKSKLAVTLNEKYSTKYRLILTGTPLQVSAAVLL